MRGLKCGIYLRDLRPRFAQPKAELTEEPLTLSYLQLHAEFAAKKRGQRRPIPHLRGETELRRAGAQCGLHLGELRFTQAAGPPRSFALGQAGQSLRFEALHPVHHRAR